MLWSGAKSKGFKAVRLLSVSLNLSGDSSLISPGGFIYPLAECFYAQTPFLINFIKLGIIPWWESQKSHFISILTFALNTWICACLCAASWWVCIDEQVQATVSEWCIAIWRNAGVCDIMWIQGTRTHTHTHKQRCRWEVSQRFFSFAIPIPFKSLSR